MTRYQIVYSKRDVPLMFWTSSKEDAFNRVKNLRKAGYSVQVWIHTKDGARITDL